MDGNVLLLLPILLPIVMGSLVLTAKGFRKNRKLLIAAVSGTLAGGVILTWAALMTGGRLTLWQMTEDITVALAVEWGQPAVCSPDIRGMAAGGDIFHFLYDP